MNDYLYRWSGMHVATFFSLCEHKGVLSHIKGPLSSDRLQFHNDLDYQHNKGTWSEGIPFAKASTNIAMLRK